MNLPKIHVMLDLETLGVKPGCKILSIGACTFNTPGQVRHSFYARADRNNQVNLVEDRDTVAWWSKQSDEARLEAFGGTESLFRVLGKFDYWLMDLRSKQSVLPEIVIWSNGAVFDAPILAEAYNTFALRQPWNFRNERCFRTLRAEFGHLVPVLPEFAGTKHNAMVDAAYQADVAEAIFKSLGVQDA